MPMPVNGRRCVVVFRQLGELRWFGQRELLGVELIAVRIEDVPVIEDFGSAISVLTIFVTDA